MRIYLDEDIASALLAGLLRKAGHDVVATAEVGMLGRADAVQLTFAIQDERVCVSRNYDDFKELDVLIHAAQGRHSGILVVRRENNPARDLSPRGIVSAIRNLEAAGVPIENEYIILNQWR